MQKIKARLSKEFVELTGRPRYSVGGRYYTPEWTTHSVDGKTLSYIKNKDCTIIPTFENADGAVEVRGPIKILEIKEISSKGNAPKAKSQTKKEADNG